MERGFTGRYDIPSEVPYGCWPPGEPLPKSSAAIDSDMSVCHNYSPMEGYGDSIPEPPGFCWNPFSDNYSGDPC